MKTHQAKIAVTRDMTPDYEREAQRDRDRLQSARTPESEPAPSKAKSSPLPWHSVYARMEALESELVQAAIDEQKLKAHADKLAECLRKVLANPTKAQWDRAHVVLYEWREANR